jgi:demethylmenaquinone methyltransferase / 2-methoxy-6-polyprenyl-1,4-benzoquinol methylase
MDKSVSELHRRFEQEGGKHPYVRNLFGRIARVYDLMNHLMTGGLDRRWRAMSVRQLALGAGSLCLDIGTGTGDLAIAALKAAGPGTRVIGIDITPQMLDIGRAKVARLGLADRVELQEGDSLALNFESGTFDGVCSAFVMRNVTDIVGALHEQFRVLKPGGRMVCLEITHPPNPFFSFFFHLYFDRFVPLMGRLVGRSFESYSYLHHSLMAFPHATQLKARMESVGFVNVHYTYLTFGVVAIHVGMKPRA